MKVVITGAEGQLGWALRHELGDGAVGLARAALDITDAAKALRTVRDLRPLAVVNCAAYTAVDKAEQEPELCDAVNDRAVGHLAEACRQAGCLLVQISTDYVFSGEGRSTPYAESDPPSPQGVYARSKLAGERRAATWEKHLIVRTCGLYGASPHGKSFVETMLRLCQTRKPLRVVNDQRCTPTYAANLARAIAFLIRTDARGLYHVVNAGAATWHEFACEIFRQSGLAAPVEPIATSQFGALAPRPCYSALDTTKYQSTGGPPMPAWQAALAECLAARGAAGSIRT
jgi:dTDP-4-dehydrorhamnose reductase